MLGQLSQTEPLCDVWYACCLNSSQFYPLHGWNGSIEGGGPGYTNLLSTIELFYIVKGFYRTVAIHISVLTVSIVDTNIATKHFFRSIGRGVQMFTNMVLCAYAYSVVI